MQDFLTRTRWDADAVRDDLQDYVVEHLGDEKAVLVLDESGFLNPDYSPAERTGRSSLGSSLLGFSVSARPSLDGERGRRVWGCGDGFLGAGTRPGA